MFHQRRHSRIDSVRIPVRMRRILAGILAVMLLGIGSACFASNSSSLPGVSAPMTSQTLTPPNSTETGVNTATPTNKPTETATATPTSKPTELAPLPEVITNTLSLLTEELNKNNEREEKTFEVVQENGAWVLTENIAERETINSTYNMQTEKYESETLVREGRVLDAGVVTPEGFIFNSNGVEQTVGLDMLATDGRATLIIKDENGEMRYKYSDYKGEWLENKWELSPDGHIYYNEAELYDGMFTINKEHPEWVEQYWEDLVRGLWNLNYVGENTAFLSQFPTDDSLVEHFRNGGKPISNLLIPSIYPNAKREFYRAAELIKTTNPVDLSQISVSIYKPTTEEMLKFSQRYGSEQKYIVFSGAAAEVLVDELEINEVNILGMKFRKDLIIDSYRVYPSTGLDCIGGKGFSIFAFNDGKTADQNLSTATQLLRYWSIEMQIKNFCSQPALAKNYNPPKVGFGAGFSPFYQDMKNISTLENTPLALR